MKLVLVHPFVNDLGGATYVVGRIAKHFDAKIYCIDYDLKKTFSFFNDVEIEKLPSPSFLKALPPRLYMGVASGISFYFSKIKDYDVINAHGTPSEWIRNNNPRVVWYCHSPNREAFDLYEWRMKQRSLLQKIPFWLSIEAFKSIEYSIVPRIEYIFANSKNTQGRIKKYLNRDSEILYPVFEQGRFENESYKSYFLYPSRIIPEKRFEFAIQAFKLFKKKMKGKKRWKLIISGFLSDRPEHRAYYNYLLSLKDEDIEFKLNVSDKELKELYGNAYAILFSPINEDFGMVPLEGFMAEKPCIAVNEGGPKETIDDGKDGFLVNTPEEMADKMLYLAERPELVERMGKEGKKKLSGKFSEKRFFERLSHIFQEIVKL
ncbi:MAG: glycosyltransferase [Candidatus Micrarchaeia archaeon]